MGFLLQMNFFKIWIQLKIKNYSLFPHFTPYAMEVLCCSMYNWFLLNNVKAHQHIRIHRIYIKIDKVIYRNSEVMPRPFAISVVMLLISQILCLNVIRKPINYDRDTNIQLCPFSSRIITVDCGLCWSEPTQTQIRFTRTEGNVYIAHKSGVINFLGILGNKSQWFRCNNIHSFWPNNSLFPLVVNYRSY